MTKPDEQGLLIRRSSDLLWIGTIGPRVLRDTVTVRPRYDVASRKVPGSDIRDSSPFIGRSSLDSLQHQPKCAGKVTVAGLDIQRKGFTPFFQFGRRAATAVAEQRVPAVQIRCQKVGTRLGLYRELISQTCNQRMSAPRGGQGIIPLDSAHLCRGNITYSASEPSLIIY